MSHITIRSGQIGAPQRTVVAPEPVPFEIPKFAPAPTQPAIEPLVLPTAPPAREPVTVPR